MSVEKILQLYRNAEISTKITFIYAAVFILLLLILNAVMYIEISRVFFRPAARTISFSMQNVQNFLRPLKPELLALDRNDFREMLVTGVVMRAVDDDGNIFIDTDEHYPSDEIVSRGIMTDPPILASQNMDVAEIGGALVYRAKMDYSSSGGKHTTIYFYRTITSQKNLLNDLECHLLILDVAGILLAAGAGYFVSRKVLKPIKTMTLHAQNIAFGKMGGRIDIPPADDEISALAKTFNEMLDRIQGGIDQQQKFILNASHELLNPATAIFGFADLLKHYGADDKELLKENVEGIFAEVHNIENILQNLLFIARTDQNRQKLNRENLELSNIVEYAVDTARVMSPSYVIELAQNDDATVFADDAMIRQLIRIFLENAVRNTPAGGKITVSSACADGKILLNISDTGALTVTEKLNDFFNSTFEIDDRIKISGGLGFAVAKWISEKHGIKISVASEKEYGTVFTLTIPTV